MGNYWPYPKILKYAFIWKFTRILFCSKSIFDYKKWKKLILNLFSKSNKEKCDFLSQTNFMILATNTVVFYRSFSIRIIKNLYCCLRSTFFLLLARGDGRGGEYLNVFLRPPSKWPQKLKNVFHNHFFQFHA